MKYSIVLLSFLTLITFLTTNFIFAEEQVPIGVHLVESNPYYFSEGGLGIEILKYFDRPLNPYLVHGKTTDESSIKEISQAYTEQSKNYQQKVIVDDNNRAMAFTVDFLTVILKQNKPSILFQNLHILTRIFVLPSHSIITAYHMGWNLNHFQAMTKNYFMKI
ncbi:hypothetical protein EMGBD3_11220 [Nitrosarchaeum sp.]|nr:hypothetical protein EMGBD3_11220 [Nitrosarchaeum sp.]